MSLQKKPALRRNFSEQKMVKGKDYALPTLIKGQDINYPSKNYKKHNFEPFKLRALNGQDKKIERQQTPISPLLQQKQQIFQRSNQQVNNIQKQTPISIYMENIIDPFFKEIRPKITKRRTMICGDFSSNDEKSQSQQGSSLQSINLQQQAQQRPDRRSIFKRITRKFSLTTLPTNTAEIKELGILEKKSNFCNKEGKKQMQKILFYHEFLKQQAELHDISLKAVSSYEDQGIHYSLDKGNNRQMIKEVMSKRWWWKQANQVKENFVNFQWTQLKDLAYIHKNQPEHEEYSIVNSFEDQPSMPLIPQLNSQVSTRTLHNHFQYNKYLGSKLSLYLSLKNYCNQKGLLVSDIILPTFYVGRMMDDQWKSFTKAYFQRLQISRIDNWDVSINKKYWIVKQFNPNDGDLSISNKIFTTYKEIKQHIEKQCKNGSKFLIQKYISKPFLFKRRKFDIRVYALVVRLKQKINIYLHKQGIINTATQPFDMAQIDNKFAHMTTESIQLQNKKFGEYEPGNKIDFHSFQSYLEVGQGQKRNFMQHAFPKIQEVLSHFARANYSLIDKSRNGSCFELIQCQFTMDEDFRPWLIDVHTNPCLQTYCVALEKVLPVVIEDVFKHTVDVIFPPPLEWPQSKRHLLPVQSKDNGFMLIFDESKLDERDKVIPQDVDEQVESDRNIYMDDLLIDDSENGKVNRLSGLQYLMNEAMELE